MTRCDDAPPPAPALPPASVLFGDDAERDTPLLDELMRPAMNGDDNPHKLVARYRKARKVADALRTLPGGTSPENVEALGASETFRAMAARLAGTNVPSEVTWALIVVLVQEDCRP